MDPVLISGLMLLLLLLLLAVEVPVAWCLAISGAMGIMILRGPSDALSLLRDGPLFDVSVYTLVVVPMYMLLGSLALHGRLAGQVFQVAAKLSGKRPAGLGVATVFACGAFAAVSGSSVATAATMARLAIPQMIRYGYPPRHAAGIVAAGGTLGILIPPSIILVVLGIVTEQSITRLLAAGIIPGILSMLCYAAYVVIRVGPRIRPPLQEAMTQTAAVGGSNHPAIRPAGVPGNLSMEAPSRADALSGIQSDGKVPYRGLVRAAIIFALVFCGVYLGWMTVSESAAFAAIAAFIFLVMELRKEGIRSVGNAIKASLSESSATTSMIFAILIGSSIFSYFIVLTGMPRIFSTWVGGLDVPPLLIIVLLLTVLVPMGMALDSLAIVVLAMPFMFPIISELGYSGIWFGILFVKMIEIGLMTPPVGMNAFVVAGSARGHVSTEQVFRGILGFVVVDLIVVAILIAFPDITLFLPDLMST